MLMIELKVSVSVPVPGLFVLFSVTGFEDSRFLCCFLAAVVWMAYSADEAWGTALERLMMPDTGRICGFTYSYDCPGI